MRPCDIKNKNEAGKSIKLIGYVDTSLYDKPFM